tara:strand:+ start:132 stop:311 length:180 start_codon:yes stop_codon:yes gene_type:complete
MGCPVHIWIPLIAAVAPGVRFVRDRFRNSVIKQTAYKHPVDKMADMKRWTPIEEKKLDS